jgi:hypothetical protein
VYSLLQYRKELGLERDQYDIDNVFRASFKYYFTPPGRKPT